MPNILFVFAHPDDETFSCGGTISRYAKDENTSVYLYCATLGEAGKTGNPPVCSREDLPKQRTFELFQAARQLGIDWVTLRNYGDGKLKDRDAKTLVRDISRTLKKVRPHVVVTFPPHGISGHPDHQVIQQATYEAVLSVQHLFLPRLYYVVIPESAAEGVDQAIHTTPEEDVTTAISVAGERKQIMLALQCHASQHLSIERVFPGVLQGEWENLRTVEYYQQVWPQAHKRNKRETDWFSDNEKSGGSH